MVKVDVSAFDNLSENEIREELIAYKKRGFGWWVDNDGCLPFYNPSYVWGKDGRRGGDISQIIYSFGRCKKLKFGNELDISQVDMLNLYLLVSSPNNPFKHSRDVCDDFDL
ncbi:MAG: hypothetical protein KKA64_00710 [Nanoarchaeota archaeon]|nr:hypothetical protein [Nanoarchaeota archaeon]